MHMPKFRHKPKKYLYTIRFRILSCTISVILLISAIVTIISYHLVSNNLKKNLIQTSETRLSFLCSSIDSNISSVKSFIISCKNSGKIRMFAMDGPMASNQEKREAREFMLETYSSNAALPTQVVRIVAMGKFDSQILQVVESPYSTPAVSSEGIYGLPYYATLRDHQEQICTGILQDPFIATKDVPMLPILYSIQHPYHAGEIGYIFTEISLSVITGPIQNYRSENSRRLLFRIGESQYQYDGRTLIPQEASYEVTEDLSHIALGEDMIIQKAICKEDESSAILLTRPLKEQGLYVTECLDEQFLQQDILRSFLLILLVIFLAACSIGFLLSWFLNRTIHVPVKQLQQRMSRIALGDFSRDPSTEWNHELGEIGRNINDLSENVLTLMNQKLEDERQKRDYEYQMLQSQINPHFLYNTLNSIKWMATAQNAPGIAEMTTSLARLLKSISKSAAALIPLKQELSLIQDYFMIQKYRYGGTISLVLDVAKESLLECQILKFTLQPIVENAIFHGIEPKGAGTITICVFKTKEQDIRIDVTDDGVGMPPEVAGRLLKENTPAKHSFFKEIGIYNVHKRLQYEFGEGYGLQVQSEPGRYTTISILLPLITDETEEETSHD